MADLKSMKGVSEKDRKLIAEAEALLGPEPDSMGFVKNLFWGRFQQNMVLPYPQVPAEEVARCDQLLAELDAYLRNEHPAIQIDQEQEIPDWVVKRLFKIGVMGMTISREYGGGGFGITSYNRALELIGRFCGSTAVMVSAHQSIGCKAIMLFGNEEQKKLWLPHLATDWLSAFCLSEPAVGCDASGQQTICEKSADGEYFTILKGEKKWATSAPQAGLFTVMVRQQTPDGKDKVSALVCTPDMEGIDIFQDNRSKCGIRGTWQGRLRFNNVKVPKFNLLHKEGRGINVALSCLNYGRCTLSAGMLGGARRAMDQAVKWSQTRYQFGDPLSDKELVKQRIAHMAALVYASDAMLYMTTGMLDRDDQDIMVETALCKCFCSEAGWQVVNDAMQIMGGESYMTENEIERIFRDSRINLIVEGSNDLMWSFIFAYGGKQLGEWMLGVREAPMGKKLGQLGQILPLAAEVFLGIRRASPKITKVAPELREAADRLARQISEFTYQFKQASKRYDAALMNRQAVQARLAFIAIQLHAWACTLSKLDLDIRTHGTNGGAEFARDKAAAIHFFDLAELEIQRYFRELYYNADDTMMKAAEAAMAFSDTQPASDFAIPEASPTEFRGQGRQADQSHIKQFPGKRYRQTAKG
ncbi:MAG: acyl-CoA dehydrogenase family protein [Phycisphaerales bacterium]|nr:acyl-CoA dehydrogenase family protein [Phycisphaerales bacterium]